MSISKNNRPQGMSQLDYLWLNYGGYQVTDDYNESQQKIILTKNAVDQLINSATSNLVKNITLVDNTIITLDKNSNVINSIKMPEEIHVNNFATREITQEDIDSGCKFKKGSKAISLVLSNGIEYLVSLDEFGLTIEGASTSTIDTVINNGIISSNLRINENLSKLSVVEINQNLNGVYANLKTENTESVKFDLSNGTLKANVALKGSNRLLSFEQLTLGAYLALVEKNNSTIYFITDKPYIYLDGVKYGNFLDEASLISKIEYNQDTAQLIISRHNIETLEYIDLGIASETNNGLMSKDTYKLLIESLKGITGSVKDYVDSKVSEIQMSEDYIEGSNSKTLKFTNGSITNSFQIDVLNWINT